ncbi:hypothetical protein [Necropsobacter rosorum]|uniref:hypothetical protein n=1 Tax=Necropsobacter rosorum TaxID=908285 RepID=UPI000AE8054D
MLKHIKNLTQYTPEEKEFGEDVLYLKGESGEDWYHAQSEFKTDTVKVAYNNDGLIVSQSNDVTALFPLGLSVIEIESENRQDLIGKYIKNGMLIDAPPSNLHEWNGKGWIISAENKTALLVKKKDELIKQLAKKTDTLKSSLLVGYPQTEIDSFYRQESEALAWQADNNAATPMLKQIAANRGIDFEVLVTKVLDKSDQFAVAVGAIIGQRQKFEDWILAAENQETLEQISKEVDAWQLN